MSLDPRPSLRRTPLWHERHDAPTFATASRRPQVLVVEDDPVQALLITLMLRHHGIEAALVTDGAQAVEAVQRGAYAMVLMDYLMPVVNGIDATRRIRAWEAEHHRPRTPIVAVTASVMHGECAAYLAAGMDGVIHKPFSAGKLAEALARHGVVVTPADPLVHGAVS